MKIKIEYFKKGYWVPETKQQLVDWLSKYYGTSKSNFNKKKKKQLYAIYFSIRDKEKIEREEQLEMNFNKQDNEGTRKIGEENLNKIKEILNGK